MYSCFLNAISVTEASNVWFVWEGKQYFERIGFTQKVDMKRIYGSESVLSQNAIFTCLVQRIYHLFL